MDEFAKPSWWISVVVAGLLVNLASAYLKLRLDGWLLRSSSWWRSRSAARLAERQRRLEELLEPANRLHAYFDMMFELFWAVFYLILSLSFAIITMVKPGVPRYVLIVAWIVISFGFAVSVQSIVSAMGIAGAIEAARKGHRIEPEEP